MYIHMNTNTTLSITEARRQIFDIAKDVNNSSGHYVLTEKGRPKAVIMSAVEFESWVETLEVARDFPDLAKDIAQAEREYKRGDYITLEELLKKQGYIKAAKKSQNYVVPTRRTKKGSKRN